jgi:hypothetical protein
LNNRKNSDDDENGETVAMSDDLEYKTTKMKQIGNQNLLTRMVLETRLIERRMQRRKTLMLRTKKP